MPLSLVPQKKLLAWISVTAAANTAVEVKSVGFAPVAMSFLCNKAVSSYRVFLGQTCLWGKRLVTSNYPLNIATPRWDWLSLSPDTLKTKQEPLDNCLTMFKRECEQNSPAKRWGRAVCSAQGNEYAGPRE